MFVSLSSFSTDELETWREVLNGLLIVSTLAVCIGVYFENDHNPDDVKKFGEGLVFRGIAFEFLFAILLWQIDSTVTSQQKSDIAVLHERAAKAELAYVKLTAPRKLTSEQEMDLTAKLRIRAPKNFWIITQRSLKDAGNAEQRKLAVQLWQVFLAARWVASSRLSIDRNDEEPEFVPIGDRGCQVVTAPDPKSVELRDFVIDAMKASDLECEPDVEVKLAPENIEIDIGLR
jgi:hypothetical protein